MTVDEIIEAANNGDADAAFAIAQFLIDTDDPDRYDKALPWCEKAAVGGSLPGLQIALVIRKAKANTAKEQGQWDEMAAHARIMCGLCNPVFSNTNMSDDIFTEVDEKFRYAYYLLAYERFMRDDRQETLRLLNGIEDPPIPLMSILKGCSLMGVAAETGSMNTTVLQDVYQALCPLESMPELFTEDADDADQLVLAQGFLYLALILRGPHINSIQRAYNVLTKGEQLLPGEFEKAKLKKELSHYQQSIFGGLRYV